MTDPTALVPLFESQRPRLRSIAYRLLGSTSDAEDAVQEAWLRLSRSETAAVDNLGGWLTTVVSNVCLDMLRARKTRAESAAERFDSTPDARVVPAREQPEETLMLAETVSTALLVVLQRLAPAERVAFVLHDMFDLSFDEIATILERTAEATRQLASRARRRVRGGDSVTESEQTDRRRQHQITSAFLSASKSGNLQALIALLDPDVVYRGDVAAIRMGGPPELRGAETVAATFKGRARLAVPILVDGQLGILVAPQAKLRLVIKLAFRNGRISEIEAIADPTQLEQLDLAMP